MKYLPKTFKITPKTNIMIVGSSGSGKSTLATRIGEITGLRVVHIDRIYWKPNWEMRTQDEITKLVAKETSTDGWVFEGNNSATHELRAQKANIIIYLNIPRYVCLYRVIKRSILGQISQRLTGHKRQCLADGCEEKITLNLIKWVWEFPEKNKEKLKRLFETAPKHTITITINNNEQIENFLTELKNAVNGATH